MARKAGKVSITSLAAELKISAASVSRAINNRSGVSEETRAAVRALLAKYDFRINYPAPRLPQIAVAVSGEAISRYAASVLEGVFRGLRRNRLEGTLFLHDRRGGESLLQAIRERQCGGAILLVPAAFEDEWGALAGSGLPVMLVDESTEMRDVGWIDNDSYAGSREAVEHLLGLGHRAIGYLRLGKTENHERRYRAYREVMAGAGIEVKRGWVREAAEGETGVMELGGRMMREILEEVPEVTAVMATNDEMAWGAMREMHKRGVRVPEEMSVVGFDDYDVSGVMEPPLTTVRHPMMEAGERAAAAIAGALAKNGKVALPREMLATRLIVRESTAVPRP